jgi:anti-sigma regulatory factor (Ser/Thr protein kinase)
MMDFITEPVWLPLAGGFVTLLVPPVTEETLAEAFSPRTRLAAELIPASGFPDHEHLAACASCRHMLLISSATAFSVPVPRIIASLLRRTTPAAEGVLQSVEFALHEAMANAVLHGNFGLPSMPTAETSALEKYVRMLDERLAEPQFALRRLRLTVDWNASELRIAVRDSGDGFCHPDTWETAAEPLVGSPSGRGIALMQSLVDNLEFSDGGREVTLIFRLDRAEPPQWCTS